MDIAIEEAVIAAERGDKPIAAVLTHQGRIIGKASNTRITRKSKVHHAENWLMLEHAAYLMEHGPECILYTTLEPCIMCIGTIAMADVRNVVVGFPDKYMATTSFIETVPWLKNRMFNYILGVRKQECRSLIETYGDERDKEILL